MCLQEVFNISIPANFLVKSLTPPGFCSPRMSLHSAPRRSRKGETDSRRLLKDFPDTSKETLRYSLALPLMQMGLKATGKVTNKDRPYTTCCLKTDFTSCPRDVLGHMVCIVGHDSPLQSVGAGEERSYHGTAGTPTILDLPHSQP